MNWKYGLTGAFIILALASGCENKGETGENGSDTPPRTIRITRAQFNSEGMVVGELSNRHFADEVKCNGYIMSPANGMAHISAPFSGIVETIRCSAGDVVKKGQVLCTISSNDLMMLQQDFLETAARLKRQESEYARSKLLFEEKISAEKDFLAIESEYKAMNSRYQSLKLRLELLKLDVAKIERGGLYGTFEITSPINGYITQFNLVLGQFTEQQKLLLEITDITRLQIQLSIFEKDAGKVMTGQEVRFNSLGEPADEHAATIISVGKSIQPESGTIQCIARISDDAGKNFINRSYIEATILVGQTIGKGLPVEAVVKSGKGSYVYVVLSQDQQYLEIRKEKVSIGRVSRGFTEILDSTALTKLLIKGVYNLPAD